MLEHIGIIVKIPIYTRSMNKNINLKYIFSPTLFGIFPIIRNIENRCKILTDVMGFKAN